MSALAEPLIPSKDATTADSAVGFSQHGIRVVFKDLEYLLPSNVNRWQTAMVLKRMSGYMNPGEMTTIMGPSGCGKSMLMDVLAGRRSSGTVNGTIEYASIRPSKGFLRRITGYVEQFNTLIENLTVYEMLMYTAQLTRPWTDSFTSKKEAVETLTQKLALGVCRDTKIGNPQLDRGISGGQAKRVNIGIALISRPRVLFMDEPISGLDSYTANEIMAVVKTLVNDGLTLCATLHSPTPFTFNLFDKVYFLLSGHVVYFGNRADAMSYFEAIAPISSIASDNDAEWLTDVVVKSGDAGKAKELAQSYDKSELKSSVLASLGEVGAADVHSEIQVEDSESSGPITPFWFGVLIFIKYRSWKNFIDYKFWLSRVSDKVVLALLAATIYYGLGDDFTPQNYLNILAVLTMWCCFSASGASVYVPNFFINRFLFYREHRDGLYRVITYFIFRILEEMIVGASMSFVCCLVVWYTISLQGSFVVFFMAFLGNFSCSLSIVFIVSNLAPTIDVATGSVAAYVVSLTFFCGFFIRPKDIPVYLRWFSKIDFMRYSLGAFVINHFDSSEEARDLLIGGGQDSENQVTVLQYLNLDGKTKWEFTGYVYLIALAYSILALLVMQYIRYDRS